MKYMELIAPCHFGMEAVLKREILDLGYEISKVEDGKVSNFSCRCGGNRTGEYVPSYDRENPSQSRRV